jgi:hypothetical protein
MFGKRFRSDEERDPIAELARLIAQADTHEESAPSDNRFREETVSGHDETPELPPAPQVAVDLNEQTKHVSAMSIVPTTKRMTSMMNSMPPKRNTKIVKLLLLTPLTSTKIAKFLLTQLRRSIRIMKLCACGGTA